MRNPIGTVILSGGWRRTCRQPQSKNPDEADIASTARTFLPQTSGFKVPQAQSYFTTSNLSCSVASELSPTHTSNSDGSTTHPFVAALQ